MAKTIWLNKAIYGRKVFNTQRELEYYRCYKNLKLDRRMVDDIHQAVGKAEGYIPCESLEEELDAWQYLIDTGMVVLSLWIPLKQRFNIGTVINILWLGTVVDIAMNSLDVPNNISIRILGVTLAILMIGVGTSIYVGAGISTGPRDGVMVGLEQRGIKIGVARTIIELFALTSGWVMGGTVGYASPFMALLIGPICLLYTSPSPRD